MKPASTLFLFFAFVWMYFSYFFQSNKYIYHRKGM